MKTSLRFCFFGSSDGRYKLSNGLIICDTHKNAKKGEIINGYQYTEENPAAFEMMGVMK